MKLPVYMDHHSTTPVDPRVFAAMAPYFTEQFGNAASRSHSFGWVAADAVKKARKEVAALIGAAPEEIVFTSGATESDNLAIKGVGGVAEGLRARGNHIITAAAEHRAVLDSCRRLEQQGFEVTYLPVDRFGRADPADVRRAHRTQTILVSVMLANNEVGTIQPVAEIGRIAHEHGALFHTDAVQAAGKLPIRVDEMNVDLLSLSAHKMYGPKGVGALYVRRKNPAVSLPSLTAMLDGGGHEGGLRSGTLNVPGIVGFGAACRLAAQEMPAESERLRRLRDRLEAGLRAVLEEMYVNGHPTERLPNNLNVSFGGVDGEALLVGLSDIAVSTGAACTSAKLEPSHVLRALGVSEELAQGSLRFGLGRSNTEEEVDYVTARVIETVKRLRELSPAYESVRESAQTPARAGARDTMN